MIPYFQFTSFNIGPITLQVWGLMVSLGIMAALILMHKTAKLKKLPYENIFDLSFWVILAALIGGRVFYILGEISYYFDNPLDVLKVWQGGMSISGGFIFSVLVGYFYCRYKKLDFLSYLDLTVFALPLGLFIGRLGCFFVFDHPGKETDFFLGQLYLDGLTRHNHGLYLSLNGLFLFILFLLLNKIIKNKPKLFFSIIFLFEYGIIRFLLDFWRIIDTTFWGLTIAQYLSILMLTVAIFLSYWQFSTRKKH